MLKPAEQNLINTFKVAPAATADWEKRVLFLENNSVDRTVRNNQLLAAVELAAYLLKQCPMIASTTVAPEGWASRYPRTRKKILFHLAQVEKDWEERHDDHVYFSSAVWMLCRIWQYGHVLENVFADLPVAG